SEDRSDTTARTERRPHGSYRRCTVGGVPRTPPAPWLCLPRWALVLLPRVLRPARLRRLGPCLRRVRPAKPSQTHRRSLTHPPRGVESRIFDAQRQCRQRQCRYSATARDGQVLTFHARFLGKNETRSSKLTAMVWLPSSFVCDWRARSDSAWASNQARASDSFQA